MNITKSSVVGALISLSLVAACGRDEKTNNPAIDGGTGGSDSGSNSAQIHIQDVQSNSMAVNTAVELHGVVVTAVDAFGDKTSAFWVEETGGGPFSGVQVFVNTQVDILSSIAPGDVVDISGAIKTEFVLSSDTTGRTTTELQSPKGGMLKVTKTGTAAVPEAHVIDAAALDAMSASARDAEYEKWEGVLVQVRNVRSRSYPISFGAAPFPVDSYKISVSDNLVVESTQTPFVAIDGLTCFDTITGVEDYFFDWLLLPRAAADIKTGTGCTPVTPTATDITAIQAATPTGVIELDNVYVTGVSFNKTSMWLSTTPTAAPNEGGYVFQASKALPLDSSIVIGSKVTVIGTVTEFNDDTLGGTLTEISPLKITVVTPTAATLVPVTGMTAAQLLVAAVAPTYESVLVTLDNVNITALGATANGFVATAKQGTASLNVGTDIIQLKSTDLGCYQTVTGFWTNLEAAGTTVTTKPNSFGFVVRTLGDKGSACN